jgi:hypothetical protein
MKLLHALIIVATIGVHEVLAQSSDRPTEDSTKTILSETAGPRDSSTFRSVTLLRNEAEQLRESWKFQTLSPGNTNNIIHPGMISTGAPAWKPIGAGAGAVVFGTAAAWLKIRADRKNDEFLSTGNPETWRSVRKLDGWSAACLISAQICIGVLAYLLLSE